jgi:hypothetical protein
VLLSSGPWRGGICRDFVPRRPLPGLLFLLGLWRFAWSGWLWAFVVPVWALRLRLAAGGAFPWARLPRWARLVWRLVVFVFWAALLAAGLPVALVLSGSALW